MLLFPTTLFVRLTCIITMFIPFLLLATAHYALSTDVDEIMKNADQGQADAQYRLGTIYYEGFEDILSYKEVRKWYRKAADQGHPEAQYALAAMHEHGRGAPSDYEKAARKWYTKAADRDLRPVHVFKGVVWELGRANCLLAQITVRNTVTQIPGM